MKKYHQAFRAILAAFSNASTLAEKEKFALIDELNKTMKEDAKSSSLEIQKKVNDITQILADIKYWWVAVRSDNVAAQLRQVKEELGA